MRLPRHLLKRPRRRLWLWLLGGANAAVMAGLLLSAYGGMFDPETFALGGIMALTFPLWLLAAAAALGIDLWLWPAAGLAPLLAFIFSWGPFYTFSPLGLGRYTPPDGVKVDTLKLLTYNIYSLRNLEGKYPGGTNSTMSYILATDADIAVLQECEMFTPWEQMHLTQAQCDTLNERYPYGDLQWDTAQGVLSKWPLRRIETGSRKKDRIQAYVVKMPDGDSLLLVNVHLQSIGLTESDKELYGDLTRGEARRGVRSHLLAKLAAANRERARQGRFVRDLIDRAGIRNVIVAGDFNDVAGCRAMRLMQGDDMAQAWEEGAVGPAITYHLNRFFFRIDHILYRGRIRAMDVRRGDFAGSDHYPLHAVLAVVPRE